MPTAEIIRLEMRDHRCNGAITRGSGPVSLDDIRSAALAAVRALQIAAITDGSMDTAIKAECCIAMIECD